MRILHTADWHLGRQLHGVSMIEDQALVLDQLFAALAELKPDCLIVAGDIFDRALPPVEAVALFNKTLNRLNPDFKKPVLIIAGNHDSPERIDFGSGLFESNGIFIRGSFTKSPSIVRLEDNYGAVDIALLPYLETAVARQVLGDELIQNPQDALAAACQVALDATRPSARRVAVAHAFVDGGRESESERPISVGGSGRVQAAIFDKFHYVALGHLHEPQAIARDGVRYSGSLCKYSFSEVSHRKSFSLVELAADGSVSIEEIPISYRRDARIVRGTFAEILKGDALNREDYILAEITDTGAIIDAMGQLRSVYPNILQMRRVSIEGLVDPQSKIRVDLRQSPRDLFGDFLRHVTNNDPEDLHLRAFDAAMGDTSTEAKGEALSNEADPN